MYQFKISLQQGTRSNLNCISYKYELVNTFDSGLMYQFKISLQQGTPAQGQGYG